jgi:hypothetical protein
MSLSQREIRDFLYNRSSTETLCFCDREDCDYLAEKLQSFLMSKAQPVKCTSSVTWNSVFVLRSGYGDEGTFIGVYSSHDAAETAWNVYRAACKFNGTHIIPSYSILPHKVDGISVTLPLDYIQIGENNADQ